MKEALLLYVHCLTSFSKPYQVLLVALLKLVVGELLNASGLSSLDWESDSVTSQGRSYRERGCILRVSIFYQNWFNTWLGTTYVCRT